MKHMFRNLWIRSEYGGRWQERWKKKNGEGYEDRRDGKGAEVEMCTFEIFYFVCSSVI